MTSTIGPEVPPSIVMALTAHFGSFNAWQADWKSLASKHLGTAGQLALCWNLETAALSNQFMPASEPTPISFAPLWSQDIRSVDSTSLNVNWPSVHQRYQHTVYGASEPIAAAQSDVLGATVVDVRRLAVFTTATHMLEGAVWRDPTQVHQWYSEFTGSKKLVVYCVAGHEISRGTALRLRALGVCAQFLQGGIEAWTSAQQPTVAKPR